jgi:hypothetical protein
MAKRFGGFTADQLGKIVPEMAGMQADEQAKFLAANPAAAARVGAMTEKARKMIEAPVQMATGGVVDPAQQQLDAAKKTQADATKALQTARDAQAANPSNTALQEDIKKAEVALTNAQEGYTSALDAYKSLNVKSTAELLGAASTDPTSMATKADVATTSATQAAQGEISAGAGQANVVAAAAPVGTAWPAAPVAAPTVTPAATAATATAAADVDAAVSATKAAQGQVSADAQVAAQQGALSNEAKAQAAVFDPNFTQPVTAGQLAVGADELVTPAGQAAQAIKTDVAESQGIAKVVAEQGVVTPDQIPQPALIKEADMAQAQAITAAGLAPDAVAVAAKLQAFTVSDGTLAEAMQGKVEAQETVQGQLTNLMKSFDDGTPAWAAGAIRAANAAMASRGLAGSSMAGAAILQAAMESVILIV